MNFNQPLTRRESIKKILRLSGGLAAAGTLTWPLSSSGAPRAATAEGKFVITAVGRQPGYSIKKLTRKAFEAAGGMGRFVSRGDVVAIKPNISWARRPELAATTNPEVLEAVIELCLEAGARRVRVVDNTIHDPLRCFALNGAGRIARKTGADLVYPRSTLVRKMKLHGQRLDVWPVFIPLVEADTVINLPVAKHHSLSTLTLGMKNWIGAVAGSRWSLHQDIHQSIVDLARFFKPDVTLIDAIRIMTANGPSGGSPSDVAIKNTLVLGTDPVAVDARAARLFGIRPEELGFIRLGQKWALGTYDLSRLDTREVLL